MCADLRIREYQEGPCDVPLPSVRKVKGQSATCRYSHWPHLDGERTTRKWERYSIGDSSARCIHVQGYTLRMRAIVQRMHCSMLTPTARILRVQCMLRWPTHAGTARPNTFSDDQLVRKLERPAKRERLYSTRVVPVVGWRRLASSSGRAAAVAASDQHQR